MMAPTDEVIAVAEALRAAGGLYVTHMRDEANDVLLSIEETLQHRPRRERSGGDQPPQMRDAGELRPLGRDAAAASRPARAQQPVAFDVYPYHAGSTVLMPQRLRPDVPVQVTWSVPHPEARRPHAGRHRRATGAPTPREAAERPAPRRRDLLPDGGAGCAADHGASAGDDRQRRVAARRVSASAAVGHVPARARPLRARSRVCSAWKTRCAR